MTTNIPTKHEQLAVRQKLEELISVAYARDKVKTAWTPFTLAKEMVDKLQSLTGKILVLSDLGFIPVLIKAGVLRENITFVAHTEEQELLANQMGLFAVLQVGYNEPIKELEKQLGDMKFDIVIGNPPYGSLHLPILKKCVEHLSLEGISVTVQPVRWLQDPLWKHKKSSDATKYHDVFAGKIDDVQIISGKQATSIFNADMGFDLGIFIIKNSGGQLPYTKLAETANGVDISTLSRLIGKTNFKLGRYDGEMLNFVPVKTIAAGGSGRGFVGESNIHQVYGFFADGKSVNCKFGDGLTLPEAHAANKRRTSGKTIGSPVAVFKTPEQAKNFYNYIKLDVFRFFVYVTTLDVHIQCGYIPFPKEDDAFDLPWDGERFNDYFGITPAESQYIKSIMENHPVL